MPRRLERLRGDAGIVLLDGEESAEDAETKRRFQQGYDACGQLLVSLDPEGRRAGMNATYELSPIKPPGIVILAALERAARQERSDEVRTETVIEHLGFVPEKGVLGPLRHRLDNLRNDGDLTRTAEDGSEGWVRVLTSEGRKLLDESYAAKEVGELPEWSQHRAWREARVQAALRIEGFEAEVDTLLEEARLDSAAPSPALVQVVRPRPAALPCRVAAGVSHPLLPRVDRAGRRRSGH